MSTTMDYSPHLTPNLAKAFDNVFAALAIPSIRSLASGVPSTYTNENSEYVYAHEFDVFFEIQVDSSLEDYVALLFPAVLRVMQRRFRNEGKAVGADPTLKTTTIPAVIALRTPTLVLVPQRNAITISTVVSFYENDISYYVLPNGESLYPKEVAKYDSEKRVSANQGTAFETIMPLLREGRRISRKSWNVGRYILLVPGSPKLTVDEGRPLARAGVPVGTEFQYAEHIDMFIPDLNALPKFGPWTPTQEDILAKDWFEWK